MKKVIVAILFIFLYNLSYSLEPISIDNTKLQYNSSSNKIELNNNYQQFKYQVINFDNTEKDLLGESSFMKRRRRKKNDNLMLYVAGGLAVATATLILVNDPDNFTSNSASSVNLGIAVAGTLASGMILAKYFIDKSR